MKAKLMLAVVAALSALSQPALAEDQAPAASAAIPPIGVINVRYAMLTIPQAKDAEAALNKEFGPREEELKKLSTEGQALEKTLPGLKGDKLVETQRRLEQMQADLNFKSRALQEDFQKRGQEEQLKMGKLIQQAVDNIAKERGLVLVLKGEAVVNAAPVVDITKEVIDRVSKQHKDAGKSSGKGTGNSKGK
ncbi:MAG: OmpH family outer membrane protein [Succinivibrio sp.]|nr:OmpH family outer membrane protein [Succinivibrio sp.]